MEQRGAGPRQVSAMRSVAARGVLDSTQEPVQLRALGLSEAQEQLLLKRQGLGCDFSMETATVRGQRKEMGPAVTRIPALRDQAALDERGRSSADRDLVQLSRLTNVQRRHAFMFGEDRNHPPFRNFQAKALSIALRNAAAYSI